MEQTDATICIPAFGPAFLTDQCLVAIMSTCAPGGVIIWDNGIDHQDLNNGTQVEETRLLDQVYARTTEGRTLTQGVWNLGFAEACNRMAATVETDLIVFLNCDTEPQPGWLEALVRAFDEPDVAVAGAQLVDADGRLRHAGVKITLGGGIAWAAEVEEDLPTRDVAAVTGACLAIRRSTFEALGGMDDQFWHVFDDCDLCLRVLQSGNRIRYVRESIVMHHAEKTGPERWTRAYHQLVRFQNKWGNATIIPPTGPYARMGIKRDPDGRAKLVTHQ